MHVRSGAEPLGEKALLDSGMTLKDIAKSVGMSEAKLKSAFRATYGAPPISFLNSVRVERAQILLANDDLSISQIAHAVGYTHPTNFTVAFRRATYPPPDGYRGPTGW